MKQTPFTHKHLALGAKMAPFAGYDMPISYTGINDEHQAVRNNAGIFDVSHMGEFILKGDKALNLIQSLTTNRIYIEPIVEIEAVIHLDLLSHRHFDDDHHLLVAPFVTVTD